jgi:hypothetical protein
MILAFAVAGAAIGSLIPGTLLGLSGAAIGWLVGSVLGQMYVTAHQPTQNFQGPRITDMRLSAGGYGAGIVKTYGSPRVNGNVIWSSDLIETANTQTVGSKKTGKQSYTTYTYSVDCAVGVCEGPIIGIRRIWANGKLIYDASGSGPVADNGIIPLSGMTFYLGTEAQTADPLMQARQGAANVPAYRGLAYVVFENLQLANFGNRHPKFDFEIGTGSRLYIGFDHYRNQPWFSTNLVTWDNRGNSPESNGDIYSEWVIGNGFNQFVVNCSDPSGHFFRTTQNGRSWTRGPISENYDFNLQFLENNKWIYRNGLYMILPYSYFRWGGYPNPSGGILTSTDGLHWSCDAYFPTDHWIPGESQITDVIYAESADLFIAVLYNSSDVENKAYFYSSPKTDPTNFSLLGSLSNVDPLTYADYSNNLCEFNNKLWTVYRKASTNNFWIANSSNGSAWTDVHQVPDDDGSNSTYIAYILSDGQRLVLMYGGYYDGTLPNAELRSQVSTDGNTWSGDHLIQSYELGYLQKPTFDGRYFIWSDIYDGSSISRFFYSSDGVNWSTTNTGSFAPDGLSHIQSISDGEFGQGTETLADVVTDLCLAAGLQMADINTAAIEAIEVKGYIRTAQMPARNAIEPLLAAYDVDAFESDGQIKFIPKTAGHLGPVIPAVDLGAQESNADTNSEVVKISRTQELELANEITVRFIDRTLDYDANQQYARRLAGASDGSSTIDAPVVMSATEAFNLAQAILYRSWIQRDQYQFSTTQKYGAYEPTDLLGIPYAGKNQTVRLIKKEENGFLINWTGVSEDLTVYDQNFTGSSGNYGGVPIIPAYCDTDLLVFETPVLRDEYDLLGFVAVAGGQTAASWAGGNLYITAKDGTDTLVSLGPLANRAITGTLTSNLTAVTDPITSNWDNTNTFSVSIPWGQLESHTEAEVLAGMNTCVVTRYGGSVEVLGFCTATLTAPGQYTLSKLLRRIRQNSSFSGAYTGARFALLTADSVKVVTMQLPDLNSTFTFAGPAIGTSLDAATTVDATLTGMSKKPLSPILLKASRAGDEDVTFTWTRRTRIGGSWPTGEDGPLGEAYEMYEIDIMDTDHTTVLRTLTAVTTSVEYTAAQQLADFGSPLPDAIEINVYQISDFVGRGYPGHAILHILGGANCDQDNTCTTGAVS